MLPKAEQTTWRQPDRYVPSYVCPYFYKCTAIPIHTIEDVMKKKKKNWTKSQLQLQAIGSAAKAL